MFMDAADGVTGLWDYHASGTIWRILPAGGGLIVGEERDTAAKRASYFCVTLDEGRTLWKGVQPAAGWWTGIDAVCRGMIFIHEYPVPSMPDHGKIFAVDAATGGTAWENADLAFGFVRDGAVYASRDLFERKQYFELELRGGTVLREVPAAEVAGLRALPEPEWEMEVELPRPSGEAPAAAAAAFPAGTALEPGETLSRGRLEICNVYEAGPDQGRGRLLREHLFVLDAETGGTVFRDIVCDGLSRPAGTTFFRAEERILYVRGRTALRSFSLSTGGAS
jgi:hypothetical protein